MFQRLHNCIFLFRRALGNFYAFRFRKIIIPPHIQPALSLDLGDIQAGHLQAVLFQHIGFDLIICGFALRRCQIQFVQVQLHLDIAQWQVIRVLGIRSFENASAPPQSRLPFSAGTAALWHLPSLTDYSFGQHPARTSA